MQARRRRRSSPLRVPPTSATRWRSRASTTTRCAGCSCRSPRAERLIDRPPPSIARLRRRAQDDRARLLEVLRSEGYYGGQVEVALDSSVQPIKVTFRIDLGPVYRLGSVSIEVEPPEPGLRVPSPEEIGLKPGEPAAARTILDAEQALLNRVRAQGFILAALGPRRAVVDHDTDLMDVTLRIQPGPLSRFGPVTFDGLTHGRAGFRRQPARLASRAS